MSPLTWSESVIQRSGVQYTIYESIPKRNVITEVE